MADDGDKAFSSIDFVGQCLVDEKRTAAFQKAIKESIKEGDVVLDLGTGSGILASIAAKAGAKDVIAVEYDSHVASIASDIIRANGLESKISIIVRDARTLSFRRKMMFDAVLAEMLTTGMVDEHQVSATNNLHSRKLVGSSTIFIPRRQDTFVALARADYTLYSLKIPMILHLWKWHDWRKLRLTMVSDPALLNSIDFRKIHKEKFKSTVELTAKTSGSINGIHLTSVSVLSDNISVGDTEALNSPMLIPIEEKTATKGEKLNLEISYTFGGGYGTLKARFV